MRQNFAIRRKLVFVLGSQRSGTTAMLQALGQDSQLQAENEHPDNEFYFEYRLRPEPTIRSNIWQYRRRIILKPVADVDFEPVEEIVREFEPYDPLVVWLYRDPVNVWSSAKSTFDLAPDVLDEWIGKWRAGNESLLQALDGHLNERFIVVRYEDLVSQRQLFAEVCQFLEIRPVNNLFWREDRRTGRQRLSTEIQKSIADRTQDIVQRLDQICHKITVASETVPLVPPLLKPTWNRNLRGARLLPEKFNPRDVSIELDGTAGTEDSESSQDAVQLYHSLASMRGGSIHVVSFWMRSDRPTSVNVQITRDGQPWENLGFSSLYAADPEWSHVGFLFPTHVDIDNPRLHLTVSATAAKIEISRITVGPLHARLFQLHTHRGSTARLNRLIDYPGGVTINIEPKPDAQRHDIQLILTQGWFEAGITYRCWIWSRSFVPGEFGITLGLPTDPWDLVSDYRTVAVEPAEEGAIPTPIMLEFIPDRSGPARLYVEIPNQLRQLDILYVSIRPGKTSLGRILHVDGAGGRFEPADDESAIRLRPSPTPQFNHADVQWDLDVGPGFKGIRYSLSFRMRADASRPFGVGLSESTQPFTPIDIYFSHSVDANWRSFYFEVVLDRDWPGIRALFDLGGSDVPVEIADVRLSPVADRLTRIERDRLRLAAQSITTD